MLFDLQILFPEVH